MQEQEGRTNYQPSGQTPRLEILFKILLTFNKIYQRSYKILVRYHKTRSWQDLTLYLHGYTLAQALCRELHELYTLTQTYTYIQCHTHVLFKGREKGTYIQGMVWHLSILSGTFQHWFWSWKAVASTSVLRIHKNIYPLKFMYIFHIQNTNSYIFTTNCRMPCVSSLIFRLLEVIHLLHPPPLHPHPHYHPASFDLIYVTGSHVLDITFFFV